MAIELPLTKNPLLTITQGLPETYDGLLLPGSHAITASSHRGTLSIQIADGLGHSIGYQSGSFYDKIKAYFKVGAGMIHSLTPMKGDMHFHIKGIGGMTVRKGQYVVLHAPGSELTISYDANQPFQHFSVGYSEELIAQLLPSFPQLQEIFKKATRSRPFMVTRSPKTATPAQSAIPIDILRSPYTDEMSRFYFETKVRELLFLELAGTYKEQAQARAITGLQKEKVELVRAAIGERLDRHYSIPELARMAVMNERDLKEFFRMEVGKGMFEYLRDLRLEQARELLEYSDLEVKQVYSKVGYKRVSSFITEFRKRYGYTPGSIKRNR